MDAASARVVPLVPAASLWQETVSDEGQTLQSSETGVAVPSDGDEHPRYAASYLSKRR